MNNKYSRKVLRDDLKSTNHAEIIRKMACDELGRLIQGRLACDPPGRRAAPSSAL
jgi:hypothetical protein